MFTNLQTSLRISKQNRATVPGDSKKNKKISVRLENDFLTHRWGGPHLCNINVIVVIPVDNQKEWEAAIVCLFSRCL